MNGKRIFALLTALAAAANLAACQNQEKPRQQPPEQKEEQRENPAEILPGGAYFPFPYEQTNLVQLKEGKWRADEQGITLELTIFSPYAGGWTMETGEYGDLLCQDEDGLAQGEQTLSIPLTNEQTEEKALLWRLAPENQPEESIRFELPQTWETDQIYQLQDGRLAPSPLRPYTEVRSEVGKYYDLSQVGEISERLLRSLIFDQQTIFPAEGMSELTPDQLMEQAMDPGLGIRQLHQRGITGQGVSVAIIDQPIPQHHLTEHPEYAGKFAAYQNFTDSEHSMHGPAVASLLVGEHCGAAPGAKLYYVAANPWDGDAQYFADALNWLIELNQTLPEGEKIRVVSVSAAPGSVTGPFEKNRELWEQARQKALADGILVLDVTEKSGIQLMRGYLEPETMQDPAKMVAGAPDRKGTPLVGDNLGPLLHVPTSRRTTAGMWMSPGCSQYTYWGVGGLSWGMPYAAGVLALGWQVRPDYTPQQMLDLLLETAATNDLGAPCINPPAFIQALSAAPRGE